jgi:CBS domain-containing protein
MAIDLKSVLIPTKVITADMTVKDVFVECGQKHIHALPFANKNGVITGRLTLKNIMEISCLPNHMVELAHLLGSQMSCVDNAEAKAREVLCNPVEPYVRPLGETIPSSAPLIKALAIMDSHDTSYIFVVDDGVYQGIITIQGIARAMSELQMCKQEQPVEQSA